MHHSGRDGELLYEAQSDFFLYNLLALGDIVLLGEFEKAKSLKNFCHSIERSLIGTDNFTNQYDTQQGTIGIITMAARSLHDGLSFLLAIALHRLLAVAKGMSSSGIAWEAQPPLPYTCPICTLQA